MPADAADYLHYYGLDFSAEFPLVRHSLGYCQSGDYRLAVHCWEQPGAGDSLLLVHGYFDHVGLYGHLVRFGLGRGGRVVAFDLPGHGLSSGPRSEIGDFAEYRQALCDVMACTGHRATRWQVIAQSTGAAAVMDLLQCEGGASLDRVVLLAPLVWPHGWRRVNLAWLLLHRWLDSVPRQFADNSQDPGFLEFLRVDPMQPQEIPLSWLGALRRWLRRFLAGAACDRPVLVVQGDADGTVDWGRNLVQIRRLFPNMQLYMLPGGRHHLANEGAGLRADYLLAVSRFLDSAEPGATAIRQGSRIE